MKHQKNKSSEKNDLVFKTLQKVPKGKVISYKDLGLSCSAHPRLIGKILHGNTNPSKYPCHRVVRSDRTIAAGFAFGGPGQQRKLLENEGITFTKNKIHKKHFIAF